jgi:peptidoglycan hydrolase-like protein with peptidoglycan-binding domain
VIQVGLERRHNCARAFRWARGTTALRTRLGERVRGDKLGQSPTWISKISFGVAILTLAAATAPAEARERNPAKRQVEEPIADPANGEPMTLAISLHHQKIDVYRGTTLIASSQVSTGMRGYATKAGVFSILQKKRYHHSNIYSGAPMPWMQRLTWSGTALHAGVVPGYPASHGCIRLLFSFAPMLFKITSVGEHVVVAQDSLAPKLIEHANLFQSLQPPTSPIVAIRERAPERPSDKAPEGSFASNVAQVHAISAGDEDTRAHAIDLTEGASVDRAIVGGLPAAGIEHVESNVAKHPVPTAQAALSAASYPGVVPEAISGLLQRPPTLTDETEAPSAKPSSAAAKLAAGTKAAALEAADRRSTAPLRILLTRRTLRDRVLAVQSILAGLGYLTPQAFDGTLGRATVSAIKDFEKANGPSPTGSFTDELIKKVYEISGKKEPPIGHLFVRQEFARLFDVPVSFRNPDKPLGTHLFTAMKFVPGETRTQWIVVSLEGDDPVAALDRLEIPDHIRQKISERLTPGSSLIIGDTAINTAALPKGADFVVWAKQTPNVEKPNKTKPGNVTQAKVKQAKVKKVKQTRAQKPNVAKIKQAETRPAKAKKATHAKPKQSKAASSTQNPWFGSRRQRYSDGRIQQFDRIKPAKHWTLR